MPEAKSPLFNRTYLKVIVWIVAIAIVLLTAGQNDTPDFISIKKHPQTPLYYVNQSKAPFLQLSFLFRTEPAISSDQQLLQQLLLQQFEQQLSGFANQPQFRELDARISIEGLEDRIVVTVMVPYQQSDSTDSILAEAKAMLEELAYYRPANDLEKRLDLLEAEQYLNQKDPETHLLSRFRDQISGQISVHPLQRFAEFYRTVATREALTLTLQGPVSERLAESLSSILPENQRNTLNPSVAISPSHQRLQPQGNQSYLLSGIALPGRQQQDFLTELLAVRTLQHLLQQQHQTTARLVWKSLDQKGYLALILQGPKSNTELRSFTEALQTKISDELIDNTRSQLMESFHTQMEQPDNQLSQLDTIAFYQLSPDYLNRFEKKLNQTDNGKIREQVRKFLTGPGLYQLILPAY